MGEHYVSQADWAGALVFGGFRVMGSGFRVVGSVRPSTCIRIPHPLILDILDFNMPQGEYLLLGGWRVFDIRGGDLSWVVHKV